MPKVSVITPSFNGFGLMANYWNALEHQTFRDFEVVIVDDASSDDSYDELCKYRSRSRLPITVLRNERNMGPGKSRRRALESARGEWIAFCDCDDWYEVDFLEKMMRTADELSADLVMCNINYAFPGGRKKTLCRMDRLGRTATTRDYLVFSSMTLCSIVVRRELFVDVEMPGLYHCEDGAVVPQLLVKAKKIAVTTDALYNYFIRNASLSTAFKPDAYLGFLEAYDVVYDKLAEEYYEECEFIGIKMVCYGATLNAFKAGVPKSIVEEFLANFRERHPNWSDNPYIGSLDLRKRVFLKLLEYGGYGVLKWLSRSHSVLVALGKLGMSGTVM